MQSTLLNKNSEMLIVDPEGEYTRLARMLGGKVIRLNPGGADHINLFEDTKGGADHAFSGYRERNSTEE